MEHLQQQPLEALYREAFPRAAAVVRQLGGDLEAAKDLFHDAVIIYLEKKQEGTLNIHTSAPNYLTGIVKFLWMKQFRATILHTSLEQVENHYGIPDDFYSTEKEQTPALLRFLQTAGKKCMQLLQAFYYDQWSMQQIADTFHYKTSHSATVQKHKCIEKIREQLKQTAVYEEVVG